MSKVLFVIASVLISSVAQAQHYHHHHRHGHNFNWVAPIIIGGAVGYAIANSARAEPAPPIYIEQSPATVYTCPYGTQPLFNRSWTTDRWGRYIQVNQFIGCQ